MHTSVCHRAKYSVWNSYMIPIELCELGGFVFATSK